MAREAISVVIATYNGAEFLRQQLDSFLAQTRLPDELIVADDASSDSSVQIVQDFARTSPFPVSLTTRKKNIGYGKSFWQALQRAKGDVVLLSDQDDVWLPEKIKTVVSELSSTGNLMITHDLEIIDEHNNTMLMSYYDSLKTMNISPAIVIHGCASAFRMELLKFAGFPKRPEHWAHDTWLCGIATALKSRTYLAKPLIRHRLHGRNASGWFLWPKTGIKSAIYKISIPPFTASNDLDYIMEFYATKQNIAEFRKRVETIAPELDPCILKSIFSSIRHRSRMVEFSTDPRYRNLGFRVARALASFIALDYKAGGRLPGLARDLVGRRSE